MMCLRPGWRYQHPFASTAVAPFETTPFGSPRIRRVIQPKSYDTFHHLYAQHGRRSARPLEIDLNPPPLHILVLASTYHMCIPLYSRCVRSVGRALIVHSTKYQIPRRTNRVRRNRGGILRMPGASERCPRRRICWRAPRSFTPDELRQPLAIDGGQFLTVNWTYRVMR